MTAPADAAGRFLWACLLGLCLGAAYDFLRPLRPRHTLISDGLFLLAAFLGWLYLGFGVCGGDLRLGYAGGLIAGGLVWEWTAGLLLRPVFSGFWKLTGRILRIILVPLKKISEFVKILFASAEKWVTIKWNNRRHMRRAAGGISHGRKNQSPEQVPGRISPQQSGGEDRGDRVYRVLYPGGNGCELGPDQR